jgi:hypothetical protein
VLPGDGAVQRVEGDQAERGHEDDIGQGAGLAGDGEQHRRGDAGGLVQGLPGGLSLVGVEGGDGSALAADTDDHAVADHQRRAADTKARQGGLELLVDVHLPEAFAAVGLVAAEHASDAVGVDLASGDGRRALRAGVDLTAVGGAVVGVAPQFLAGLRVEGDDLLGLLTVEAGVDEDAPAGDGGDAEAVADLLAPQHLGRLLLFPGFDLFGGGAVAFGTEPLRPVGGGSGGGAAEKQGQRQHPAHGGTPWGFASFPLP